MKMFHAHWLRPCCGPIRPRRAFAARGTRRYQALPFLFLAVWSACAIRVLAQPLTLGSQTDPQNASATGNADSMGGEFSGDARYLVFISRASNLTTNDLNPFTDVFVRDLEAHTTRLVSLDRTGHGGATGDSSGPVISADGRWVAFESNADNLVADDTDRVSDVFLHDLTAGVTVLVSADTNGFARGTGASSAPTISPDGRYVAFESLATNLVTGTRDTNGTSDVFLRDVVQGVTSLVSKQWSTNRAGSGASTAPRFSADGSRLVFTSQATNLVAGVTNTSGDIYVRDLPNGVMIWVSRNAAGLRQALTNNFPASAKYRCYNPVISANGRFVAFKMALDTATPAAGILRHDMLTGATDVVATNVPASLVGGEDLSGPAMSPDGRFVAYEGRLTPGSLPPNLPVVWLWDGNTLQTELASASGVGGPAAVGPSNTGSDTPALSADGRFVAFLSYGTNLVPSVTNSFCRLYVRDRVERVTKLVSGPSGSVAAGDSGVVAPSFSPDGQRLAFQSLADDLVPNDFNKATDVFVRDLAAGQIELVSSGWPSATPLGLSTADTQSLSVDGRWLLFTSQATLVAPDTNNGPDVFLRDMAAQTNILVSANAAGSGTANGLSRNPLLSTDGQVVVFTSFASNLVPGFTDTNQAEDVYVRFSSGLVSCVVPGESTADKGTASPSLSADGDWVAYQTRAALAAESAVDTNAATDIYLRSLNSVTNLLLSLNAAGTAAGNGASELPALSPDGRWVVFQSQASDLVDPPLAGNTWRCFARNPWDGTTRLLDVGLQSGESLTNTAPVVFSSDSRSAVVAGNRQTLYQHAFEANQTLVVCSNCAGAAVSADGRWVAFQSAFGSGTTQDIVLRDVRAGTNLLVSVNRDGTGGGNADSSAPLMSAEGRFVVFSSQASDLVAGDTNGWTDVFVRDVRAQTTVLVSLNPADGAPGDRLSSTAAMGADGRTIVFTSFASNLVPGDANNTKDVFLLRLPSDDLDHDGLPDDWELSYFGNLDRDGSGDFDGDGLTDAQEYLAGTDPTNRGSVLQVLTLTSVSTGTTRILWSAVAGRTYRVQFKDSVDQAEWSALAGDITAAGTQAGAIDNDIAPAGHRFYRVVLVR